MAEQRDVAERLERGKRCIEQMGGRRHDIADMYWDRYEDIMHLNYWLTLRPSTNRAYVRLSFTIHELTACGTDPDVCEQLRRRIHAAMPPLLSPSAEHDACPRLTTTEIYLNLSPEHVIREFREKW